MMVPPVRERASMPPAGGVSTHHFHMKLDQPLSPSQHSPPGPRAANPLESVPERRPVAIPALSRSKLRPPTSDCISVSVPEHSDRG